MVYTTYLIFHKVIKPEALDCSMSFAVCPLRLKLPDQIDLVEVVEAVVPVGLVPSCVSEFLTLVIQNLNFSNVNTRIIIIVNIIHKITKLSLYVCNKSNILHNCVEYE